MKKLLLISFLLILMVGFVSCKQKETTKLSESKKKEVVKSKLARLYPAYNPQHLKDVIHSLIQKDSLLIPFYTEKEYYPIWTHDTLDTKKLETFLNILDESKEHGLPSGFFSSYQIKSLLDSIDAGRYELEDLYRKIADIELISTKSAVKYITGMNYGFVEPKQLYKKDYAISLLTPDSAFYKKLYQDLKKDPIEVLTNSLPTDRVYLALLKEYRELEAKKEEEFRTIPNTVTYKLGDKSKNISGIAWRLMLTGEYAQQRDSVYNDSLYLVLDENLMDAINLFRKRNSYPEDKEVDKLTINALNRPIQYYQAKLHANMERYRWKKAKTKHDKHIEVNVASASLAAIQKDSLPLIMRVCVGTINNKTPLLQSDINYLNLNPVWNIPTSIAQKEVAVLQKKDPTYISRRNMKLYKNGKEVDASTINWSEVNPSKFSYTVRQSPGGGNSLGLVKFMFNNSFSVYLHDTPSKSAFGRKNRAVSHGCVRVQKPFDLAFFCMSTRSDDIYKDRLYYSINKPPISEAGKKLAKENKLKKLPDILNPEDKISLSIDYYTAYMYPSDDTLYYADDIYGYDNAILDALQSQLPDVEEKVKVLKN